MPTDTIILGDMGGTRLRLARRGTDGDLVDIRKYDPQDWESLQAAIADYAPDAKGARLFLSFAKKVNAGGLYHLDQAHKKGVWSFTIADVRQSLGLADMHVLHDMQAMGRAVFHTAPVFNYVAGGNTNEGWRCIINVGTGLGHAFINADLQAVHDTFGGHFPPIAVTDEQKVLVDEWQAKFTDRTFVVEEILSSRGLMSLVEQKGEADGNRLFCEFLGLYANTLCVGMDAFGGIYFGGGVMEDLFSDATFNADAFMKYFILDNVPIVNDRLRACPIYRTNLPFTALYGLDVYADSLSDH